MENDLLLLKLQTGKVRNIHSTTNDYVIFNFLAILQAKPLLYKLQETMNFICQGLVHVCQISR